MSGRRSLTGIGRISLIYTLGTDQAYNGNSELAMTASVGEDFAECSWPVSVKCQANVLSADLVSYLEQLAEAVGEGFWINPRAPQALYWRWTGVVPPGMDADKPSAFGSVDGSQALGTGRRSAAGAGPECGIYLMDKADRWRRPEFYGRIHGTTAVSASVGEDFAKTHWPIVVKTQPNVSREELLQYLTDAAACVREGFFVNVAEAAA